MRNRGVRRRRAGVAGAARATAPATSATATVSMASGSCHPLTETASPAPYSRCHESEALTATAATPISAQRTQRSDGAWSLDTPRRRQASTSAARPRAAAGQGHQSEPEPGRWGPGLACRRDSAMRRRVDVGAVPETPKATVATKLRPGSTEEPEPAGQPVIAPPRNVVTLRPIDGHPSICSAPAFDIQA